MKMINHEDPIRSFAGKLETGLQIFGAAKGLWNVGRAVAPYLMSAGRVLAAM